MRYFGLLLLPLAAGGSVCESCRFCASLVHTQLDRAGTAQELITAVSQSLAEDEHHQRCRRYLTSDRHILQRLLTASSTPNLPAVWEALCVERLRCPAGGDLGKLSPSSPPSEERTSYQDGQATYGAETWPGKEDAKSGAKHTIVLSDADAESCDGDAESCEKESGILEAESDTPTKPPDPLNPHCAVPKDTYRDLLSTRVVLVVFSGRWDRLRILMRYLRRDLRSAGGVVDKIIFALWQVTAKDLTYLRELADAAVEDFELVDFSEQRWGPARLGADPATNRMVQLYQSLNESGTVYVKVDDDVVYVAEHAIANLVRERLRQRCLFVSANVVNHAIMSAVHQDRGAHRAFFPPARQRKNPSLRLPWKKLGEINMSPDFTIERFPASRCVVERWDCAALVHESFLDRAADGTWCIFDFGWLDFNRAGYREHKYIHRSPSVNKDYWTQGARWSTNFFAFMAEDLEGVNWNNVYGKGDDEEEFTGPHAERRDRHSCAVGSALVVHFSYGSQEEGLMSYTNLLKRYDKLSRRLTKVPKMSGAGGVQRAGKESA
ncbi:unnamed protein product [Effrenium voratum]|nr:unnamed protein product [Effrenium voratum]